MVQCPECGLYYWKDIDSDHGCQRDPALPYYNYIGAERESSGMPIGLLLFIFVLFILGLMVEIL